VEDGSSYVVPAFYAFELNQDTTTAGYIAEILEQMYRFDDPTQFGQCTGQIGWAILFRLKMKY
jgi:hypothetical protein